ncbi:O-acetyl-ADP-ribose deacetylase (regulator of RNase III), contains Macro domain [Marivirga sericea]|uniref:O-acetyl-ADP-ribose deacetylase (Regulator of RNase III), contains Macro domain n=1 Tax=Marivirga sericea TaxID=1028 RepID=A0A1X7KW69_9BACT|nr:macro domain-containing protein [Marivirga sericea]SMG45858.1 O-acetyl-ADP-ribose deacetylase (regulator of RNase III), contains Macro domain [Marivirga sericea]
MGTFEVKLEVVKGDITQQKDISAIVNAANAELQIGSGVAGAIHTAAGEGLAEECRSLAPIKTGEAVITDAYSLPNEYIIHVLGPIYGFNQPEVKFLGHCYEHALALAEKHNIESIAFPAISTGAFGYPFEEATEIALKTVQNFLSKARSLKLIRFVLFSDEDFKHYEEKLPSIT